MKEKGEIAYPRQRKTRGGGSRGLCMEGRLRPEQLSYIADPPN